MLTLCQISTSNVKIRRLASNFDVLDASIHCLFTRFTHLHLLFPHPTIFHHHLQSKVQSSVLTSTANAFDVDKIYPLMKLEIYHSLLNCLVYCLTTWVFLNNMVQLRWQPFGVLDFQLRYVLSINHVIFGLLNSPNLADWAISLLTSHLIQKDNCQK